MGRQRPPADPCCTPTQHSATGEPGRPGSGIAAAVQAVRGQRIHSLIWLRQDGGASTRCHPCAARTPPMRSSAFPSALADQNRSSAPSSRLICIHHFAAATGPLARPILSMQPHLEPDGHGPGMLLLSSLASRFVYTRETAESSSLCCKIWHFTPDSYTLFAVLWLVLICCERKVLLAG